MTHDSQAFQIPDKAPNNWSAVGANVNGYVLRSLRCWGTGPAYLVNNYGSGIVFGGVDTKGVMSLAYDTPLIKFAGGNATQDNPAPTWWLGVTGNNGATYNLQDILNKANNAQTTANGKAAASHTHPWSQVTGAPATATRWPSWGEVTGKPTSLPANGGNSDTVDGCHEYNFLRYRTSTGKGGDRNTLFKQIGIKDYNDENPDGVDGAYRWGGVASFAGGNSRLDLYYTHRASDTDSGLRFRSGWGDDKRPWQVILDSHNYNNYAPTKTGGGASGTWGINITGSAGSIDWSKVGNKPAQATRWPSWGEVTGKPSLLGTGGGTMTGTITFAGIGDVAKSTGLSWGGSTDGASIYYQTTAKDQGNLVLNCTDDANCYIRIAYNGEFKSYFSPSDGVFHGNVAGNASSASSVAWGNVSGKPGTFTPSAHNHAWGNITGAPATATRWPSFAEVTSKPTLLKVVKWDANTGTLELANA